MIIEKTILSNVHRNRIVPSIVHPDTLQSIVCRICHGIVLNVSVIIMIIFIFLTWPFWFLRSLTTPSTCFDRNEEISSSSSTTSPPKHLTRTSWWIKVISRTMDSVITLWNLSYLGSKRLFTLQVLRKPRSNGSRHDSESNWLNREGRDWTNEKWYDQVSRK